MIQCPTWLFLPVFEGSKHNQVGFMPGLWFLRITLCDSVSMALTACQCKDWPVLIGTLAAVVVVALSSLKMIWLHICICFTCLVVLPLFTCPDKEMKQDIAISQLQNLHGSWLTTNQGRQNVKHKGVWNPHKSTWPVGTFVQRSNAWTWLVLAWNSIHIGILLYGYMCNGNLTVHEQAEPVKA